jgi:hypothetical protein
MAIVLGTPMRPRKRKSLEEIIQAERERKNATQKTSELKGTLECKGCGNVKYNAEPKEYYCTYCDEHTYHRLIA